MKGLIYLLFYNQILFLQKTGWFTKILIYFQDKDFGNVQENRNQNI